MSKTWPRGIFLLKNTFGLRMPIWEKPYLRGSDRRKLGFWEEVRLGAKSSPFVQDLVRRRNERARACVSSDLR